MSDSDKGNIGTILVGIGLALLLFYGASAIFAVTGDESLDTASTWTGLAAALGCVGLGFPLVIRYGRSKPASRA